MGEKEFEYGKVKKFWRERAGKEGNLDRRSITFFCEEPETLDFRDRTEKALFDERVKLTGEEKLLEVGCGSGRWTEFLARRVQRVTAFDFAEPLIDVNRKHLADVGVTNVAFEVSDGISLDLAEKDFDVAVCFGVSLYVKDDDLERFYRGLRSHLADGGTLLSKEPTASGERIELRDEYREKLSTTYSCIYRPRTELEAAIEASGFRKLWTTPVYKHDEPLAPHRDGVDTWLTAWSRC